MLKQRVQHGENLNIPVVVDRCLAVRFQMVRVDHVHIAQIRRGGFIGYVHRVFQRQVPDREGFELRVSGLDPPAVFLIQLAQAGRHLSAAGARRGHQHQRARRFDIIVLAESLVAHDVIDIRRISGNRIMPVGPDLQRIQPLLEGDGRRLVCPAGQHHGSDIQSDSAECVNQAQSVQVIRDSQIPAHLALLFIVRVDDDDDLFPVLQLQQHLYLAVRLESGKYAAGMEIVKQFAAELQVEFSAEFINPLDNPLGLHPRVPIVVKTDFHPRTSGKIQDRITVNNGSILRLPSGRVNAQSGRFRRKNVDLSNIGYTVRENAGSR